MYQDVDHCYNSYVLSNQKQNNDDGDIKDQHHDNNININNFRRNRLPQ